MIISQNLPPNSLVFDRVHPFSFSPPTSQVRTHWIKQNMLKTVTWSLIFRSYILSFLEKLVQSQGFSEVRYGKMQKSLCEDFSDEQQCQGPALLVRWGSLKGPTVFYYTYRCSFNWAPCSLSRRLSGRWEIKCFHSFPPPVSSVMALIKVALERTGRKTVITLATIRNEDSQVIIGNRFTL